MTWSELFFQIGTWWQSSRQISRGRLQVQEAPVRPLCRVREGGTLLKSGKCYIGSRLMWVSGHWKALQQCKYFQPLLLTGRMVIVCWNRKFRGEICFNEIKCLQFASVAKSVHCLYNIHSPFLSVQILILFRPMMCQAQRYFPASCTAVCSHVSKLWVI